MSFREFERRLAALEEREVPVGEPGPRGFRGEKGEAGLNGRDGINGLPGSDGARGEDGKPGPQGERGLAGPAGRDGKDGLHGKDGLRGERGPQGPQGPIGPMPEHEWDDTRLRFEIEPGRWGKYVDLRGPKGNDGRNGMGARGPQGPVGPQGPPGSGDALIELVAEAAAVSALRVIVADGAGTNGRIPDVSASADAVKVLGISSTAAAQFGTFSVQSTGPLVLSVDIPEGPVFCGVDGVLSSTPPASPNWLLQVGVSLGGSPSTMLVDLKTPIIRV